MMFIKVLNQKMAEKLSKKGFVFSKEEMNGKELFVFSQTDALLTELHKNFSDNKKDYFIDNRIYFREGG